MKKPLKAIEARGEIESPHPGYLGIQDSSYIDTIKSVGRIRHQTFVDTRARVAICKLHTEKITIT